MYYIFIDTRTVQYIHTSSYIRTWSCYNPKELQQQCELKVVYDNLKKNHSPSDTFQIEI